MEISNSVWPDSIDVSHCQGLDFQKDSESRFRVLNTSLETSARDQVMNLHAEEDEKAPEVNDDDITKLKKKSFESLIVQSIDEEVANSSL